jgi:hypothetical protein
MLLQQHLQAPRQRNVAEALALEIADRPLGLARKLNDCDGERADYRQKKGDETIEFR